MIGGEGLIQLAFWQYCLLSRAEKNSLQFIKEIQRR
jgi:hypothetical protein